MSDRYDQLLPPDIVSAIKSMPRRWSSALLLHAPDDVEGTYRTTGADGASVAEHTGAMLTHVRTLSHAIAQVLRDDPDPLGSDVDSALANAGIGTVPASAVEAVQSVRETMEELAARLESLRTSDWTESASTPTTSVTVTQLARGAVRVAADRLRAVEGALT